MSGPDADPGFASSTCEPPAADEPVPSAFTAVHQVRRGRDTRKQEKSELRPAFKRSYVRTSQFWWNWLLVGVLRTYCNHNLAIRQLTDLIDRARKSSPRGKTTVITARVKKLTPVEVNELCSLYQSGSSTYSLAKVYGIRHDQVSIIMKRAGVEVRPGIQAKLSEKDKDQIAQHYESGLSIHKLALRFGVTDNPVHSALIERGVQRRPRQGGRRGAQARSEQGT